MLTVTRSSYSVSVLPNTPMNRCDDVGSQSLCDDGTFTTSVCNVADMNVACHAVGWGIVVDTYLLHDAVMRGCGCNLLLYVPRTATPGCECQRPPTYKSASPDLDSSLTVSS